MCHFNKCYVCIGSKLACEEKHESLEDEEGDTIDGKVIVDHETGNTDKENLPPKNHKTDNRDEENLPTENIKTGKVVRKRKRKLLKLEVLICITNV